MGKLLPLVSRSVVACTVAARVLVPYGQQQNIYRLVT